MKWGAPKEEEARGGKRTAKLGGSCLAYLLVRGTMLLAHLLVPNKHVRFEISDFTSPKTSVAGGGGRGGKGG